MSSLKFLARQSHVQRIRVSVRESAGRSSRSVNGWLILILLMVFAVLVYRMAGGLPSPLHDPKAEPHEVVPRDDLPSAEQAQISLFRDASPSVVYITTLTIERKRFSRNLMEIPQGTGSGFVWDDTGNIVTNFHVIQEAQVARVTLADNSTYAAVIVGVAPDKDLAVLKIDAPADRLKPLRIGTSANLQDKTCWRSAARSNWTRP